MAKQNLVVVESAAKARTIEKFLGRNYIVRACLGHVRDLPTSKLGVDVTNNFEPQYVIPKDRRDLVKRLKDEARGAESVILATDPDREGEAIAWHLVAALGLDGDKPIRRIEFHEITQNAVKHALEHPRTIDLGRVHAQQARRVLDRLIGYPVSNFLARKVRRGLSAGRVQSAAVRLVVEREREIQAFLRIEYWTIEAELAKVEKIAGQAATFTAGVTERAGAKIELHAEEEARTVQADLEGARWTVAQVKEREQQRHPAAPFTTSTLQQEASRKLNFTAKRTMVVAQQLYEGVQLGKGDQTGLITYMRTDSVNVSQTAVDEVRHYIGQRMGTELVPPQARVHRTRSRLAQEAHEAIRPTSVFNEPESVKQYLSNEQYRLYDLVWKRFVASQMRSAIFDVTTVEVDAQAQEKPAYRFRATGSRLKFRGFLSLYLEGRDDNEVAEEDRQPLPRLAAGELLKLETLTPGQHFTQPPPRYTEATLVKALEERGIGRPSTYAPTLSTIQDRGYVDREGKALHPSDIGILVNDLLVSRFGDILDLDFTANMEERLDQVAQGDRPWVPVVEDFYRPLTEDLLRVEAEVERIKPVDIPTDEVCSQGHPMVIKAGRFGKFVACSQYPEHKETKPLPEELPPNAPEEHCSHGQLMQLRTGRFGPFYTSMHECSETKTYAPRVGVPCPLDGGDIVEKRSRKGRVFYGCSRWPQCEWVSWYRPLAEPCDECGGLVIDMGRGRTRCLKHEGEPVRASRSTGGADGESDGAAPKRKAAASRNGRATGTKTAARNGRVTTTTRTVRAGTKAKTAAKTTRATTKKAGATTAAKTTRARPRAAS